jgi:EpsI family protein
MALGLLAVTAVVLSIPLEAREVRRRPQFEMIPTTLGAWTGSSQVPTDAVPVDSIAREHLSRTYRSGDHTVWLSVGYYPSQSDGNRPAVQELLYPRRGWTMLTERALDIALDSSGRTLAANRVVMHTGHRAVAVVYWYQMGQHSIASHHWYRAHLVYNRLRHGRADVALVRVVTPVVGSGDGVAELSTQASFIKAFYPELLRSIP